MMADNNFPKAETSGSSGNISKLSFIDLAHIKEIEQKNRKRVEKLLKQRKANRLTAGLLTLGVFSIYGYTIHAMRQEDFLDDFNEPEKIHD